MIYLPICLFVFLYDNKNLYALKLNYMLGLYFKNYVYHQRGFYTIIIMYRVFYLFFKYFKVIKIG